MYDQPKYSRFSPRSDYFSDHRTMRPPVEGAVARETLTSIRRSPTGRLPDDSGYVLAVPRQVDRPSSAAWPQTLTRGQDRYGIYCVPCHDATGSGQGAVVKRAVAGGAAALQPPTYHPGPPAPRAGWSDLRHHHQRHSQHAALRLPNPRSGSLGHRRLRPRAASQPGRTSVRSKSYERRRSKETRAGTAVRTAPPPAEHRRASTAPRAPR